jgi:glycosyltransferase involved in cell wall biosynthesis
VTGPAGETASPCRALFVVAGLPAGGAERQLVLLLRGLDRGAFTPGLLIFNGQDKVHYRDVFEELRWFRALSLSGHSAARLLWPILAGINRAVREFAPDVVFSTLNVANHTVRASRLLYRWAAPIVTSVRADFRQGYRLRERIAERLLWRSSDYIVCNSPAVRDDMIVDLGIPASRIGVVANGLDPIFFEAPTVAPPAWWPQGRAALVVGRFSPEKNHLGMIKAVSRLDRAGKLSDWRFVLVGEGPLENDIRAAISNAGLGQRVALQAPVPDPWRLYHAATVVVIPSRMEALPNVALEAQAAGRPVAITAGANRAGVVDAGSGFFLGQDLCSALADVLSTSDDELARRGAAARQRMLDRFSADVMVQEMQRLLRRVAITHDADLGSAVTEAPR